MHKVASISRLLKCTIKLRDKLDLGFPQNNFHRNKICTMPVCHYYNSLQTKNEKFLGRETDILNIVLGCIHLLKTRKYCDNTRKYCSNTQEN